MNRVNLRVLAGSFLLISISGQITSLFAVGASGISTQIMGVKALGLEELAGLGGGHAAGKSRHALER